MSGNRTRTLAIEAMIEVTIGTLRDNFPDTLGGMSPGAVFGFTRATLKTLAFPDGKSITTVVALGVPTVAIFSPSGWAEVTE